MELSVVVAVYGCAAYVEELHDRLQATLEDTVGSFEIIFVDDRSTDGVWPKLVALSEKSPNVTSVRLSRNFGQQLAISAGLAESNGESIVVMDCDLQDPPELIPKMLEQAQGVDILMMQRRSAYNSLLRIWSGKLYFRLLSVLCGVEFLPDFGSFSLISRKVARVFGRFGEIDRHYNFILLWLGFERKTMTYERDSRLNGSSSYTLRALLDLAVSGIFFQTTIFLKWVIQGGLAISILGILSGAGYASLYLFGISPPPGWTSLIVINLFLGGVIIISIGTVGVYVAKIFEHSKSRPLYVIDEVRGQLESTTGELS